MKVITKLYLCIIVILFLGCSSSQDDTKCDTPTIRKSLRNLIIDDLREQIEIKTIIQSFAQGLDKNQAADQAIKQAKNLQPKITYKKIITQNINTSIRQATCNAKIDIRQDSQALKTIKLTYFVHYLDYKTPYIQILK